MSDPTRAGADPAPRRSSCRPPPLVWIILALVAAALLWGVSQYGGMHTTPRGGETPMAAQAPAVMPPAAANGSAPATRAG